MKWNSDLCTLISKYIFWLWFCGLIYIEESCGELRLTLVSNDAVCSSRPCCNCEEQSAYGGAGVEATLLAGFQASFMKKLFTKIFKCFLSLRNVLPDLILLHNLVTIHFNIILPLKVTSVECCHFSELKRILISKKFF